MRFNITLAGEDQMERFYCILEEKECVKCYECEMCDLNRNKVCDNCGKCIDSKTDYRAIEVDRVVDGIIED